MTNQPNQRGVRITRTDKNRSPDSVRRLGRALIALVQAQLEVDAQAQAANDTQDNVVSLKPTRPKKNPPDHGDAA